MDFKQLFDDDRAVSPVIGVILMVAITVILAAVIGTFVLGLGDQVQNTTPRASFGFDTSNSTQNVTISHESGDTIEAANLKVSATQNFSFVGVGGSDTSTASSTWANFTNTGTEVSAGSSVEINSGTINGSSTTFGGETIRVIYDSPDSDSSSTLGKFEVPN